MPDQMDQAADLNDAWAERCIGTVLRRVHAAGALRCFRCEEAIPAARLEAYPGARYCMPCQQHTERRKR